MKIKQLWERITGNPETQEKGSQALDLEIRGVQDEVYEVMNQYPIMMSQNLPRTQKTRITQLLEQIDTRLAEHTAEIAELPRDYENHEILDLLEKHGRSQKIDMILILLAQDIMFANTLFKKGDDFVLNSLNRTKKRPDSSQQNLHDINEKRNNFSFIHAFKIEELQQLIETYTLEQKNLT